MNTVILTAFVALAAMGLAAQGIAASDHDGHGGMRAATSEILLTEGIVKKIDKSAGKVTIAHGPLVNLGMPAMTMDFRVSKPAWLAKMKEGQKIRFTADQVAGNLTVMRYEPAK
jgi:Cu(I)/Ag(I) efflux system periplasmic protein CusF